ncbi:ABC transporter permease [Actinacidiphila glaucinigra]|uniref:ABC transporter permease n=1 Tax=Actinacidiphila glaucinigra TaxID=235986 RepID=UPI003865DCBC
MNALTGTGTLTRLALRRDRVMIPAWVVPIALLVASTASAFGGLYDTPAERAGVAASTAGNGSLRALYGPVFDTGIGGLTAWRMMAFGSALAGLMAILLVVRHTREEEEAGRLELVGAGAVGRRAPLAAALVTGFGAALLLGLLVTLALLGQGARGAVAFGIAFAGAGCSFAAVAAVAAQLTESARAARGISGAVLGLAFLARAVGDAGSGTLTWLSPLGWAENIRPFADERWWVAALFAAWAAGLVAVAYALVARRDIDASLLPTRPGPATAGRRLRSAQGLAWRLQRGSLWGWTAGFAAGGAALGGLADGAADLVRDNERLADVMRDMGGASGLVDSYLASMTGVMGMIAAIYAVQAVLRLQGEENSGRAEPVLTTGVGRVRWAAGHALLAFAGSVLLMAVSGFTMGLGYGVTTGDAGGQTARLTMAGLVQLPAVWFVAAVALLLYGAAPKAARASWGVASLTLAIGLYGPALRLSPWVMDLSVFTHLPKVPSADVTVAPLAVLTVLALALAVLGLAALRRRDITT